MTMKKLIIWLGYPSTSNMKGYTTFVGGPRITMTYTRSTISMLPINNEDRVLTEGIK